jgi:hypothetical protein
MNLRVIIAIRLITISYVIVRFKSLNETYLKVLRIV